MFALTTRIVTMTLTISDYGDLFTAGNDGKRFGIV